MSKVEIRTKTEDVLCLKAEVDYVKFATADQETLVLDSRHNWEEKLSGLRFVRTHRSYIVNLDKVEKISENQVFIGDDIIPIDRTYKEQLIEALMKE